MFVEGKSTARCAPMPTRCARWRRQPRRPRGRRASTSQASMFVGYAASCRGRKRATDEVGRHCVCRAGVSRRPRSGRSALSHSRQTVPRYGLGAASTPRAGTRRSRPTPNTPCTCRRTFSSSSGCGATSPALERACLARLARRGRERRISQAELSFHACSGSRTPTCNRAAMRDSQALIETGRAVCPSGVDLGERPACRRALRGRGGWSSSMRPTPVSGREASVLVGGSNRLRRCRALRPVSDPSEPCA